MATMEDVALLAELHGLPTADLAPLLNLTPQRKKERMFEALLRQLEGLARQQPVLLVFNDIHWIDPSSQELVAFYPETETVLLEGVVNRHSHAL